MKKRIIAIALSLFTTFTFFCGCKDKEKEQGVEIENIVSQLPETVEATGINVIENGKSDYKIVVSATADDNIKAIASEIQYFYEASSGVELPIVLDTDLTFDDTERYISLGNTTVFQGSGLEITADLRETGYIMKRIGNTLICNGKK